MIAVEKGFTIVTYSPPKPRVRARSSAPSTGNPAPSRHQAHLPSSGRTGMSQEGGTFLKQQAARLPLPTCRCRNESHNSPKLGFCQTHPTPSSPSAGSRVTPHRPGRRGGSAGRCRPRASLPRPTSTHPPRARRHRTPLLPRPSAADPRRCRPRFTCEGAGSLQGGGGVQLLGVLAVLIGSVNQPLGRRQGGVSADGGA